MKTRSPEYHLAGFSSALFVFLTALPLTACFVDDAAERCPTLVSSQSQSLSREGRKFIGAAGDYPADGMLRSQFADLRDSQKLRREAAWRSLAKLLAPLPLKHNSPALGERTLPLWQSWFGKDEILRIFDHWAQEQDSLDTLPSFTHANISEALQWNLNSVEELDTWSEQRWQEYLDSIDSEDSLAGVGGIPRVGYSPAATRSILHSYREILDCIDKEPPAAFAPGEGEGAQAQINKHMELAPCSSQELGPYFVGQGEELKIEFSSARDASLQVAIFTEDGDIHCDLSEGEHCSSSNTGIHYVSVQSAQEASVDLQIQYRQSDAAWASCLNAPFALDSVIVKASWRRAELNFRLPVYDTSAAGLAQKKAENTDLSWGDGDSLADPGPDSIYTVELSNGQRYRLAGLHMMSKELDHWQWISLWWSDTPDSDFGADRPEEIATLAGPWNHYKMCTASFFEEGDPRPGGGYEESAPSLAAALAEMHEGQGEPSWCSNPYIEEGAGNMQSNCIGCHQHAGLPVSSESILSEPQLFPDFGRSELRNNFPHDYSWALSSGDNLALHLRQIYEYYLAP